MKQENLLTRMMRGVSLLSLIFFACFASTQAQEVVPRVCVELHKQKGSVILTADAAAGSTSITVDGAIPVNAVLIINQNRSNQEGGFSPGLNQEHPIFYASSVGGTNPFTVELRSAGSNGNSSSYALTKAHSAGEVVEFELTEIEAFWGYNNMRNAVTFLQKGITGRNFFAPGPLTYPQQPGTFQVGIDGNAFSFKFPSVTPVGGITWFLDGRQATAGQDSPHCGTITYQGRLSEQGAAANGQYDLRFSAFDAVTDGTAQSNVVTIENAQVTNGVFTVQLNFGSSFFHNNNARFLEIAVRPGAASGGDPFTTLAPRQPITSVPFADTAQKAFDAQLVLTPGAPDRFECSRSTQRGQMRVDATNNLLYVCTATGWKSTVLQ